MASPSPDLPDGQVAIAIRNLSKVFAPNLRGARVTAVNGLNLTVPRGEIFGLLGPNGSGKSTTIKIILGFLAPTAGTCTVLGARPGQFDAKSGVGYLPESPDFPGHLTGRELVHLHGRLCGLSGASLDRRIAEVLRLVDLESFADRRIGSYSKGMRQRIGLAQAAVHDPELLVLDEPTAGIDPLGCAAVLNFISAMKAGGKTVLLTSHALHQLETVCDQVAVMDRGRCVLAGRVADLVSGRGPAVLDLEGWSGVARAELIQWLTDRGHPVRVRQRSDASLESVYRRCLEQAGDTERKTGAP